MISLKNKFYLLLFLSAAFFQSCGDRPATRSELISRMNSEKSGLVISKTMQNVVYSCKLRTPELITLQNSGKKFESQGDYEKELQEYKKDFQVVFTIKDEGKANHVRKLIYDEKLYGSLIAYSNTEMSEDFKIKTSEGKIVPCSFVHLEPSNSMNPVMRLTLGFRYEREKGEELTVVFNDRIFNNGPVKFYYEKDVLDYSPKLKI